MATVPWLGVVAFVVAHDLRLMEDVQAARERGQFICTRWPMGAAPCALAAIAAGAALYRRYWVMALIGIPTVIWVATRGG